MAQAVSRQPLTADARVRARVSPCGGETVTGTGFSRIFSVYSVSIIPPWLFIFMYHLGSKKYARL
jgi:hypothetical protein